MTFPKARVIVAACLFVAWLGFLLYLVIDARRIVLSKPQFLVAQAYVVVEANAGTRGDLHPSERVTVKKVLWSARTLHPDLTDQDIDLPDLAECTKEHGYQGERQYLLPLIKSATGWKIAPLPRFTNYPGPQTPTRIYAWTADTEAQVEELIAAKNK